MVPVVEVEKYYYQNFQQRGDHFFAEEEKKFQIYFPQIINITFGHIIELPEDLAFDVDHHGVVIVQNSCREVEEGVYCVIFC